MAGKTVRTASRGQTSRFTPVDRLIVVLALSILALLIIPKVGDASDAMKEPFLLNNLSVLQRAIDRYQFDHGRRPPHRSQTGAAAEFIARLTQRTDHDGALNSAGPCGPYLRGWPVNPFGAAAVAAKVAVGPLTAAPRDGSTGWYFSTTSHRIMPNSPKGGLKEFPPARGPE
jgi:competence protein ComGC